MNKANPDQPHPPETENSDLPNQPQTKYPIVSQGFRNPQPTSNIFTILPNVDTESLLCHTCENLASLNVMATVLAEELEGPQRNVSLVIQQLAVLSELLVNQALDNLDQPRK